MNCPMETQETTELLAYCAGKLEAYRSAAIEQHVQACATCAHFVEGQKRVWKTLDAWEAPPVSADFDRRLYARIDQEVSWLDRLMRPLRPLLFRQGLPIAATAALLLAAGLLVERPRAVPVSDVSSVSSTSVESLAPEQVEHALDVMETMREFNGLVHPDPTTDPKM